MKFKTSPIMELYWREYFRNNERALEIMNNPEAYNVTNDIIEEIKESVEKETNFCFQNLGKSGTGKSNLSLALSKIHRDYAKKVLGIDWDILDYLFFTTSQTVKYFRDSEDTIKVRTIINDEQISETGTSSYANLDRMRGLEDTQRKNQVNFIFNSVEPVYHAIAKANLIRIDFDNEQKIGRTLVMDYNLKNPLGVCFFKEPDQKLIDRYNAKKDEFNKMLQSGTYRYLDFIEIAKLLIKKYDIKLKKSGRLTRGLNQIEMDLMMLGKGDLTQKERNLLYSTIRGILSGDYELE